MGSKIADYAIGIGINVVDYYTPAWVPDVVDLVDMGKQAKQAYDYARVRYYNSKDKVKEEEKFQQEPPPKENLEDLKKEYAPKRQEIQSLKHRADQIETRLKDIHDKEEKIIELKNNSPNSPNAEKQIEQLENSCEKAYEFFKREYNIKPEQARETVEKLRKQAAEKEWELKPAEEKIKILEEQEKEKRMADNQKNDNTVKNYNRIY